MMLRERYCLSFFGVRIVVVSLVRVPYPRFRFDHSPISLFCSRVKLAKIPMESVSQKSQTNSFLSSKVNIPEGLRFAQIQHGVDHLVLVLVSISQSRSDLIQTQRYSFSLCCIVSHALMVLTSWIACASKLFCQDYSLPFEVRRNCSRASLLETRIPSPPPPV